ncbi:coiled-coil domain-containing protein 180 isoform X2 [Trichomycterus rosablanca]|uniref:coiled-coil domain-containing protein 180 isoform X2 n=1 Tax=Trichomycterus rosablanca TaxID=2290929 RepID=UPI002F3591EB
MGGKTSGLEENQTAFCSQPIQNPNTVQDTLNSMQTTQQIYSEQRLRVLEQIRAMTPPKCTKSIAAEWYFSLCSIDEQIDSLHSGTMTKLRKSFEDTGQVCLSEIECFRNKVSTYGFTSDEIQEIVNAELLPLIDEFQTQAEEQLAAMDRAIEDSAKTAGIMCKSLFKFLHGAAELWEEHSAKLQKTDQHLQDLLDEVRDTYEQQNQKKEAQLDLLMDKLRQESTEDTLKTALEKTLTFLEEVKNGYVALYKAEVETVESYPAMVLEELRTYSSSVSRYFFVKEVYTQNHEELRILYPSLMFDARHTSNMKKKRLSVHLEKKPCSNVQTDHPQTHSSLDFAPNDEEPDCSRQESRHFQANETFITTKGNVYNCQAFLIQSDHEVTLNNMKLEQAFYPKTLIIELQKVVIEEFFNHLEQRYHWVLNDTVAIMEAKRQELKSELDLRLHLHKPRTRRIEMDIHNVRATELILHRDRVDRHCKGILQALTDFQNDFKDLQAYQHTLKKEFHTKISKMEETLITATKSDKLVKLSTSLQTSLVDHMAVIQKSQRQFRQNLEIKFEGLREANAQLMKSFKLFSEGGNFTPKEIENYQKRLEKMAKRIDLADEALMQDMEVTESKSLEQAKEIISKAEEKCQCLTVDLIFLEKIQRVLTNTQVKIKAEVMKSNMHKKTINNRMTELEEMLDAYSQPCPDKKAVTSDDVFNLTTYLIEELRKRCQYLNCYLDHHMAVPVPDTPLQGAFAVAARPRSRMQEKMKNPDEDSLLQPSRMGTAFVDDAALGVIKGLLRISKPQANQMVSGDLGEKGQTAVTVPVAPSSPAGSGQKSARCWIPSGVETLHRRSAESVSSLSVKRLSKPTRFDKRFQVFGSKPEAQQKLVTFKVFITSILWEANDGLLRMAEDYYKKKERRPISRPQYIQDTFEQCAEELNKRLLVYQSQTEEYHSGCVQEFQQQLKTIEKFVSQVPEALLTTLKDQHLEDLNQSMKLIHQQFEMSQQQSEQKKKEHSSQLRVRLSHPACEEELNRLVTAEDNRHDEQKTAIQFNRLELQAFIMKNADEFVTVLATLTENLLFQLDNILMPSEVQGGLVVSKQEKITPLIHHRLAGTLLKDKDFLFERGSRTWPGIRYYKATDDSSENQQQRETASITTAKTTMAHLQAIEVRNALHQSYEQKIMKELEKVQKFSQEQEAELLRWQTHWRDQLKTLSSLNSG